MGHVAGCNYLKWLWQAVFEISGFPISSRPDLGLEAQNSCVEVLQIWNI